MHLGVTFVEVSGRILHFCSSKCINNWKLGRDARKVKWVKKQKKEKKSYA
jgi:large subunit ribosomal protein L24e